MFDYPINSSNLLTNDYPIYQKPAIYMSQIWPYLPGLLISLVLLITYITQATQILEKKYSHLRAIFVGYCCSENKEFKKKCSMFVLPVMVLLEPFLSALYYNFIIGLLQNVLTTFLALVIICTLTSMPKSLGVF